MQRCFRGRMGTWMYDGRVDVRPRRNQHGDALWAIRKVARPVCHNMQQRPMILTQSALGEEGEEPLLAEANSHGGQARSGGARER